MGSAGRLGQRIGVVEFEVFEETDRGPIPARIHYVERNTLGPALCGIAQVDHSVHNRFVSMLLPLNLANGLGFENVERPKCARCASLRDLKAEK